MLGVKVEILSPRDISPSLVPLFIFSCTLLYLLPGGGTFCPEAGNFYWKGWIRRPGIPRVWSVKSVQLIGFYWEEAFLPSTYSSGWVPANLRLCGFDSLISRSTRRLLSFSRAAGCGYLIIGGSRKSWGWLGVKVGNIIECTAVFCYFIILPFPWRGPFIRSRF